VEHDFYSSTPSTAKRVPASADKLRRKRLDELRKPFDKIQGRPFDQAQGRPFDQAQGRRYGWAAIGTQYVSMDLFLSAAVEEAERGLAEGGIPIGAVLVYRGTIIGRGHNRRVQQGSAVLHGEMDALERAGRRPASVYRQSVIYTTLSPCAMCSGAILLYGIPRVVVGENQTFMGEEDLLRARGVVVEVVQDQRCVAMMNAFIAAHPELWNEDIGT
jgi:creatinine deaminase